MGKVSDLMIELIGIEQQKKTCLDRMWLLENREEALLTKLMKIIGDDGHV